MSEVTDYTPAEVQFALYGDYDAKTDTSSYGDTEMREYLEHNWTYSDAPKVLRLRGEDVMVERLDGKEPAEGGGEDVWYVFGVGSQLFRKSGYYASHYGTDWDGPMEEVHPVKKTVTVYKKV